MTVRAKGIDPKIVHYGIRNDDLARVEAIGGVMKNGYGREGHHQDEDI